MCTEHLHGQSKAQDQAKALRETLPTAPPAVTSFWTVRGNSFPFLGATTFYVDVEES